jgi:hypothetical protein
MIITSQDWDGVTSPALPSGWYFDLGFATATSALAVSPASSPNLLLQAGGVDERTAYYLAPDGSGGNVRVSASFSAGSIGTLPNTLVRVMGRGANLPNVATTPHRSCYSATIDMQGDAVSLEFWDGAGGGVTTLGVLSVTLFGAYGLPAGTWVRLVLRLAGSAIAAQVQRLDTAEWLDREGAWVTTSDPVDCLSATDGSITGSGYAGLSLQNGQTGAESVQAEPVADDFLFESLADSKPRVAVVPAKPCWWLRD